MRCGSCGEDNPASARFCGGCGVSLATTLPCLLDVGANGRAAEIAALVGAA